MTIAGAQGEVAEVARASASGGADEQKVVAECVGFNEGDRRGHVFSLLSADRDEMPAKAADPRPRQRVERADETGVEQGALPAFVEPALHRKSLRDDLDLVE